MWCFRWSSRFASLSAEPLALISIHQRQKILWPGKFISAVSSTIIIVIIKRKLTFFSSPPNASAEFALFCPAAILLVAASRTLFPLVPAVAKASALIPALTSRSARVGHSLDSVVLSEYWLYHNYLPLLTLPASPPPIEERHSLTSSAGTTAQHLLCHRHGNGCDHSRHCIQNCSRSRLGTQSNQVYPTVEGHHHPELSGRIFKTATLHCKLLYCFVLWINFWENCKLWITGVQLPDADEFCAWICF